MPLTDAGFPVAAARAFHPLTITGVRRETDDAVSVTLQPGAGQQSLFGFQPGQYLTLRTRIGGEETRRAYSICAGLDDGALRVAIKRVEGGRFSGWAHGALAPGQTIEAMPPAGRFTVVPDPAAARRYLGVAAGSGITPILSIMKSVLAREPGSRFALVYGSRRTAEIMFRDELEALKDRYLQRLSITHTLSREQQDIPILNGRLDAAKVMALLPGLYPSGLPDRALLCGPGGMIGAVTETLERAGVPAASISSERFAPDGQALPPAPVVVAPQPAAFATVTVIADGVSTAVPVSATETVLEAALRAGLDLPYSCRAGMCSTCRARVMAGSVSMDVNYGLEPWETAAGYVLTCQSRPSTPAVIVDYDQV